MRRAELKGSEQTGAIPLRVSSSTVSKREQPALQWSARMRCLFILMVTFSFTLLALGELSPETTAAFDKYISSTETRVDRQNLSNKTFLWIDQNSTRLKSVRDGGIASEHKNSQAVPGGMIQHWVGGVFVPGATIERVKQVDQNYSNYTKMYSPEISQPKILSHDGNHFVVSCRITKKKILTVVLDTVHSIDYIPLGEERLAVRSRSLSVNQVEYAGTSSESILKKGEGTAFLWAMNSYWRMEERDGGVYIECEAITLSRDVPFGMGAMINPILQSFAEESLKKTLDAKRSAVTAKP